MTLLSDIWGISTIIKIEWNYTTQSSVHNHTSYIHQDILSWTRIHWLQQQIAYPTKYKLYNIYNYYVLKLSIKSSFRYTNNNINLLIYDIYSQHITDQFTAKVYLLNHNPLPCCNHHLHHQTMIHLTTVYLHYPHILLSIIEYNIM